MLNMFRSYITAYKQAFSTLKMQMPAGKDQRGVSSPMAILGLVVAIGVGVFVLALLIPTSFDTFFGVETTSWDAQTVALWIAIPVFALLAIALAFIFVAIRQSDG